MINSSPGKIPKSLRFVIVQQTIVTITNNNYRIIVPYTTYVVKIKFT